MTRPIHRRDFLRTGVAVGAGALAGDPPRPIHHPEWNIGRIGFQPYPYPSATRFILSELSHVRVEGDTGFLKPLDPDHAAADLVDDTFVQSAIRRVGWPRKFDGPEFASPWVREEIVAL